jgi:carbon monoxide dehydrogenase subunit G
VRIENAFTVAAPLEQVFGLLSDVEQVAPCMPGATIVGRDDGGDYRGRFRIKVGPVSAGYEGSIAVQSTDPERGEIVLRGSGADPRGAGSAAAVITARVDREGDGTKVVMVTDLDVAGRLAQFSGRSSMMQSVADRMIGQFADGIQGRLAAGAAAPANGSNGSHGEHGRPDTGAATDAPKAPAAAAPAAHDAAAQESVFDAGSLMGDMLGGAKAVAGVGLLGLVVGFLLGRLGRGCGRRLEVRF